jgi:HlyD family secretion protein
MLRYGSPPPLPQLDLESPWIHRPNSPGLTGTSHNPVSPPAEKCRQLQPCSFKLISSMMPPNKSLKPAESNVCADHRAEAVRLSNSRQTSHGQTTRCTRRRSAYLSPNRRGRLLARALWLLAALAVIASGVVGYRPALEYYRARNRPAFQTAAVSRGQIVAVINSTGTVRPVLQVTVGSFVSGPILELSAEFNDQVERNQVLAKIDPRIYEAAVARDRANLAVRNADVQRIMAELQRARNEEERGQRLVRETAGFLSEAEMDLLMFARIGLEAQLRIAEAGVEEAQANLETSMANLEYCNIRSPVAGTVIDRKIDQGQTLAAQFQAPELFVIAPDMQEEMHVFAAVDEADIGLIRRAQAESRPVYFTVDAYPEDLFEGRIFQVRQSSTVVQSVVTYPVIVSAANEDLKLMPGMTANLSFQIDVRSEVLRIPNAALRYYPERELVHPDDHRILDGQLDTEIEQAEAEAEGLPAMQLAEASGRSNLRHVWYLDEHLLRAVEVRTGISDYRHTEVVLGELDEQRQLVTGIEPKRR